MNLPILNRFDVFNARRLCEASAGAYLDCDGNEAVAASSTDTHVRVTRDESDLIVAFRGTADVRNWLTDLDCARDLDCGGECRVHRGFARAVESVEERLRGEIFAAAGEGRRIWLTGHSLGGALAMLFAWRFYNCYQGIPFSGIYTFGQPRVGNGVFRDRHDFCGLKSRTFRVVHADDLVPRVPWLLGFYRHAGHEVFFTEGNGAEKAESRDGTIRELPALRARQNAEMGPLSPALSPQAGRERETPMRHAGVEGGRTVPPPYLNDASAVAKLPWDLRNAWRELVHGKLALLADHHVQTYLRLFSGGNAGDRMQNTDSNAFGGRQVYEQAYLKGASSPRPSPPQVCGGEGVERIARKFNSDSCILYSDSSPLRAPGRVASPRRPIWKEAPPDGSETAQYERCPIHGLSRPYQR